MPETLNQATDIGDWALFANAYDAPNGCGDRQGGEDKGGER